MNEHWKAYKRSQEGHGALEQIGEFPGGLDDLDTRGLNIVCV
jgi:hypothetical protein